MPIDKVIIYSYENYLKALHLELAASKMDYTKDGKIIGLN